MYLPSNAFSESNLKIQAGRLRVHSADPCPVILSQMFRESRKKKGHQRLHIGSSAVYCSIQNHIKLVGSPVSQSGVAEVGATPLLFGLCPPLWQTVVIFTHWESLRSQLLKKHRHFSFRVTSLVHVLVLWTCANWHWLEVSIATQMADFNQPETLLLRFNTEKTWSYFRWRHLPISEGVNNRIITHSGDSLLFNIRNYYHFFNRILSSAVKNNVSMGCGQNYKYLLLMKAGWRPGGAETCR